MSRLNFQTALSGKPGNGQLEIPHFKTYFKAVASLDVASDSCFCDVHSYDVLIDLVINWI